MLHNVTQHTGHIRNWFLSLSICVFHQLEHPCNAWQEHRLCTICSPYSSVLHLFWNHFYFSRKMSSRKSLHLIFNGAWWIPSCYWRYKCITSFRNHSFHYICMEISLSDTLVFCWWFCWQPCFIHNITIHHSYIH